MILRSKPIIESRKSLIMDFFTQKEMTYLAILFFGDNVGSKVYVRNKQKFGTDVGCEVRIYGQERNYEYKEIIGLIEQLNNDRQCVGVLIQLPLPERLRPYQQVLCDHIAIEKDVDAMTTIMMGKIAVGSSDCVYPAAVAASIELLQYYKLGDLKGKQVSILGQSNLVGKPMTLYCIHQGAQVHSFGIDGDAMAMKAICKKSDYIISATGVVGLVDRGFIKKGQIIIDIGYGFTKDGKAAGDVRFEQVLPFVAGITPVPGGIGPMCVCELFGNIMKLAQLY